MVTTSSPKYITAKNPLPNRYIIRLKRKSVQDISDSIRIFGEDEGTDLNYTCPHVLNGFSAEIDPESVQQYLDDDQVLTVEEDGIVTLDGPEIPHDTVIPSDTVIPEGDGEGVTIYSVDTGVNLEHECFGGRAKWGKTFGNWKDQDDNGHGTHTMGTAAGVGFGPATKAKIVAVKVLGGRKGVGTTSGVIAGVDWAATQAIQSGTPSIINLSLGGGISPTLDNAVVEAINAGIHVIVAAGNENVNAITSAPADAEPAITVGSVDVRNVKSLFSNWGSIIDVWYRGEDITSAWIGSPSATKTISGTSMATPGVSGLIASHISAKGNKTPKEIRDQLVEAAQPLVTDVPDGTTNLVAVPF